jgi:DNA (cytosine-5)-methyltransferase 1
LGFKVNYLSICSGIEAASVAWEPLGFKPVAFSEIDKFASSVLAHRFPDVPNLGDMTGYENWNFSTNVDVLVGGTPCQSFSKAGFRAGLQDARGNLALVFCLIAQKFRPKWVIWENVPGVLSTNGGRDFGSIVGALAEIGYGWAYRILDAKYFGVPQQRRRVFLVGYLGDWRPAAEVLFEPESLPGHSRKSIQEGNQHTGSSSNRPEKQIPILMDQGGNNITIKWGLTGTIRAQTHGNNPIIAKALTARNVRFDASVETFLPQDNGYIRRLTPLECERLQGFPDNWTLVPKASDNTRYHAIGNSMAVPVMRWIGNRLKTCTLGSTM